MPALGMGAGPNVSSESGAWDFGWTSVARVIWEMVSGAVGSHFVVSGRNMPRMEPKASRAKRWPQTGSSHTTCIPETGPNPEPFSYVSQNISVLLKTV